MKSNKIAELIKKSGKSRCYFADKLGISERCLENRINGRTAWTLTEAFIMAEELGITIDQFVEETSKK